MQSDSESPPEPQCEDTLLSYTRRRKFVCGTVYFTFCESGRRLERVDIVVGKTGNCERALLGALCSSINLHLKNRNDIADLFHEFTGTRCYSATAGPGRCSCVDALARMLQTYVKNSGADPSPLWDGEEDEA